MCFKRLFSPKLLTHLVIYMAILTVAIFLVPISRSVHAATERGLTCDMAFLTTGYELPWKYCRSKQVTQGWGGSYSHSGTQMYYAYDFGLADGTAVRAARAGTVSWARGTMNVCGGQNQANNANYVTINHSDGTATLYLHLKFDSVYVSVGQYVSQGQTIGLSGNTGWTGCTAHLHFQRQAQGNWITNSQTVYFDEYPGQQLQQGQWYTSLNYWPGDNCPQSPVSQGRGYPRYQ